MRKWLQKVNEKMQIWMYGRYGYDVLGKVLSVMALVCVVLSPFIPLLNPIAIILMIWTMFRTYSRNIEKRRKERNAYLSFIGKIKQGLNRRKNMWKERKTHRYFKCPQCKAYLRVSKGKGKIEITCPKCRNKIIRKT